MFDTVVLFRRLKRFLFTGLGGVIIARFSLKVKPELCDFRGKSAECSLGLLPVNNSYTVLKRSASVRGRPKAFGDTSI